MRTEKISIIVPIYKVEKELDRCVQSILKQTYPHLEIILVDDGSPDRCPEICDLFAKQDKRIKVIHKKNGGLSDARNTGLRVSTGDYILYVDSDDYIELDACEQLLRGMEDDVDFVVGVCREICGNKTIYQKHSNIIPGKKYSAQEFIINSIKRNEFFAPAVLNLYKRKFLLENNLFFKVGSYFEDTQMLPRLYLAAKNIVYLDYPFYNYIIREDSIMTSSNSQKKLDDSLAVFSDWISIINSLNDKELQKYMYGILLKFYLASCRVRNIKGWKIPDMNFLFAMKYALGVKGKIRVLLYALAPSLHNFKAQR